MEFTSLGFCECNLCEALGSGEAKCSVSVTTCGAILKRGQGENGLLWWLRSKESAGQDKSRGFDPWVGKIPWRRT